MELSCWYQISHREVINCMHSACSVMCYSLVWMLSHHSQSFIKSSFSISLNIQNSHTQKHKTAHEQSLPLSVEELWADIQTPSLTVFSQAVCFWLALTLIHILLLGRILWLCSRFFCSPFDCKPFHWLSLSSFCLILSRSTLLTCPQGRLIALHLSILCLLCGCRCHWMLLHHQLPHKSLKSEGKRGK